jgi:hypothetical protein
MPLDLTAARGLLFRITHVGNLPWLLSHGLHAAGGQVSDASFIAIGNPDLIDKRTRRAVPLPPGGTLSDYVPFYFTPKSPMLLNIKTGYNGITKRPNDDIAILVSSCQHMAARGVSMLYTDRHAYTMTATWTADANDLAALLDWDILRRHDFARSDSYPDKMERYQAEALAHRRVPPEALLAIGCASDGVRPTIEREVQTSGAAVQVFSRPGWYF